MRGNMFALCFSVIREVASAQKFMLRNDRNPCPTWRLMSALKCIVGDPIPGRQL